MRLLPQSFRARLAILFGGLTLLVGLPVYWYVDQVFAAQLVVARGNAMRDLATAVAAMVAENIREREREIELLAQAPLFRRAPLDSPDLLQAIERLQRSNPYYTWLGMTDTEGAVRVANAGLLVGVNVKARAWFIEGQQGAFVGDLHDAVLLSRLLPRAANEPPMRFVDFAAPVYDDNHKLRGVLGAHAEWRWATEVVRVMAPLNARETRLEIFIVNSAKRIIFPEEARGASAIPAAITAQRPFVLDNWGSQVNYVNAMVPVRELIPAKPIQWSIVVRQPAEEALANLYHLQKALLIFGAGVIVLLLALTFWLAGRISRPLELLAGQARRIEKGDESASLDIPTGIGELRRLTDSLKGMTATLNQRREALAESNVQLEHKVSERTAQLALLNEELRQQARRDALTGLDNRLAVNERLHEEFVRMKRSGRTYAVLLLDIDHFKKVNDTHGHAVGDETLQQVAQILKASLRESDFVARYGGEEFLALLPETDLDNARQVAEKIRARIEGANLPIVKQVTISIGLAMSDAGQEDEDDAVRQADDRLYRAKGAGRNRVVAEG
ncbi:MAG: diguanylate cyclase [Betaproteobacteria bacterium]